MQMRPFGAASSAHLADNATVTDVLTFFNPDFGQMRKDSFDAKSMAELKDDFVSGERRAIWSHTLGM